MKGLWVLVLLLTLPPATAAYRAPPAAAIESAPAPDKPVTPAILATVVKALERGDVPALAKLYRTPPDPATRVLAAMALERIHFNLQKATADARVCEHSLLASQPQAAYFCAVVANGDIRLAQGERAADIDERDILRRFAGKVPAATLGRVRRYLAQVRNTPPLQLVKPSGTFDIPLGRQPFTDMQTITIEANGTSLQLVLDTGSSDIALDATWAHRLGVRMTARGGVTSGLLTHGIKVRRGILDKARFGSITLEHVPVEVVPGRQRLIGIGILRHLGAFRLAKGKLTVYGSHAKRPTCRQPMLIASAPWGQGLRLLTAVRVNDTLYTPLVDSGTSFFLSASQAAMSRLKSEYNTRVVVHGMGPRKHDTRTNWATAIVKIAGQPFQLTLPVFKDARIPWDFLLGSGALDYMDFYFDFDAHHTCMLLHDNLP